jgi:hypothetical protein
VRDAEDAVLHLMSSQDSHPPADAVKALLDLVRQSAPKKDILQGLHTALSMPGPERLVLKSLQGVNSLETDGHTRVYEGLGEADGPTPPLYRVLWGALSLDVLEGWQNPSTNAAIRLSILHAAHQAAREAQQTKAPQWSNVAYLQVRIYHGNECHRLSLRPFWDSESCTVSHIQFKQSVFDDSGPERGLLNLGSDPNSIHPIPMGKILPLEAYVCLGAHRKSRLSEAQLNYVHAQGLLAHGFDSKLLPDSARLLQVQPGRMPPAKATRVSGDKLDVMASSYHLADQVYTTISVVQYPPFGTQFEAKKSNRNTTCKKLSLGVLKPGAVPFIPGNNQYESDGARPSIPRNNQYDSDGEQSDESMIKPREPMDDKMNGIPRYKVARDDETDIVLETEEDIQTHAKPNSWNFRLKQGNHYFVDGVTGNPFDLQKRFVWFELDEGERYRDAEGLAKELRNYFREKHATNWNSNRTFYWNIWYNKNKGLDGFTPGHIWRTRWQQMITFYATETLDNLEDDTINGRPINHFWYTHDPSQWNTVLQAESQEVIDDYNELSHTLYETALHQNIIMTKYKNRQPRLEKRRDQSKNRLAMDQIPLPPTRLSARSDPAVSQLQSRIAALESKLGQAKQDENTQFLLARVLDKLDAIEEV